MAVLTWFIIRTETRKEDYVARAIERMGYAAWVPIDVRSYPVTPRRKCRMTQDWPLIARTLFADVPEAIHGDLQRIRHFDRIQRDSAYLPLGIPPSHMAAFREIIEAENQRIREWARRPTGRKPKAMKLDLHPDNIPAVLERLYGNQTDRLTVPEIKPIIRHQISYRHRAV